MLVVFINVRISVEAASPKEAYSKFCNALSKDDSIQWETDTFRCEEDGLEIERDTEELFPIDETTGK